MKRRIVWMTLMGCVFMVKAWSSVCEESKAYAVKTNAMFGDKCNQIEFLSGYETDGNLFDINFVQNTDMKTFRYSALAYSQPSRFFRLPAEGTVRLGMLWNDPKYQQPFGSLNENIVLPIPFTKDKGFFGIGGGVTLKGARDHRISLWFSFNEQYFIGYRYKDITFKISFIHWSSAAIGEYHKGFDYGSASIGYVF